MNNTLKTINNLLYSTSHSPSAASDAILFHSIKGEREITHTFKKKERDIWGTFYEINFLGDLDEKNSF